jgi:hypothetical protein
VVNIVKGLLFMPENFEWYTIRGDKFKMKAENFQYILALGFLEWANFDR